MTTAIVWFRHFDLRLHDHRPLLTALQNHHRVVPCFVLDPRQVTGGTYTFGFAKAGPHRARFLLESVNALQDSIAKTLTDAVLVLRTGHPEAVLPELARQCEASALYAHRGICSEETGVEKRLAAALRSPHVLPSPSPQKKEELGNERTTAVCQFHLQHGGTMVELEALPFKARNVPDVFTQFRKELEQHARCVGSQRVFPAPLPRPSSRVSFHAKSFLQEKGLDAGELPSLEALLGQGYSHGATTTTTAESSPRPVLPFKGGEQEALDRVQSYIWDKDCLRTYKETRNGLLRADYSSKFSPWLAHGCLSPRYVYQQVKRYEEERVKNDSTYWLLFELLWRDFFVCFALKHGNTLFHKYGPQGQSPQHPNWSQDRELFNRWAEGRTGIPFIDANMRELNASGFMSNRGRQNVASFLAKDLNIDWRMGAEYFESLLLDYDPASNYGNWLYAAGIIDPRQDRYFNILKQQTVYDKDGDYVKHWCPELAELPLRLVRQPSTITANESQRLNFYLGKDWPVPIVKLEWHGALPQREEDGTGEAKRRQRTEPKQLPIEEGRGRTKQEGKKKSGRSKGRNHRVGHSYGRKVAGQWELDKGEL